MLKCSTYIAVAIVLFFAISLSFTSNGLSKPKHGYIKIDDWQADYKIYLDDSLLVPSFSRLVIADTGWHAIQVLNPKRGIWNYNDWQDTIYVDSNDTTSISPVFSKPLHIQTDPFDAQVFLNDSLLGTTPLHIELSAFASGVIRIQKELYVPITILLDSLNTGTINVELPLKQMEKSLFEQTLTRDRNILKRKKVTTISLMAITLCSGFTTAYLKDQAEQRYEKYLKSGNIEDMDRYLKESKRLDKYAAVSLGVFEVSFSLSFISLLKTVAD